MPTTRTVQKESNMNRKMSKFELWFEDFKYAVYCELYGQRAGVFRTALAWVTVAISEIGWLVAMLRCSINGHTYESVRVDPENGYEEHTCRRCGHGFEARF
jgi:hypothetical protein